jgi:sporulation protein YlmC with PRC-barrel domain
MTKFKKVKDSYGMKVFTDKGYLFGEIEEAIIEKNRIASWRIKSIQGSSLASNVKNAKGIILPYKYFLAFGDIVIVKNIDIGGNTTEINDPIKEDF